MPSCERCGWEGLKCPHCKKTKVVKIGTVKGTEGVQQRYKCNGCGRTFY